MANFFIASTIILLILLCWVSVSHLAKWFAQHHPEFGPYVEKRGCGGNCTCSGEDKCDSS